jgi:hypothetical protein
MFTYEEILSRTDEGFAALEIRPKFIRAEIIAITAHHIHDISPHIDE